jgi:hypothetical protein
VFCSWSHLWSFCQFKGTTVFLKSLAINFCDGTIITYSQPIDLCHETNHGDDLPERLGVSTIFSISSTQSDLSLQFGCPGNCTPSKRYDISCSRLCSAHLIHCCCPVPISTEICIHIYLKRFPVLGIKN